jgi:soluble lytic murein transglycosylase
MLMQRYRYRRRTREYLSVKAFPASLWCLLFALCICTSLPSCALAGVRNASSSDAVSALGKGKDLLDKGLCDKALESLEIARAELPVIGDYTLFFMAQAYNRLERFDESSRCISDLLETHGSSPLRRKARALQIDNLFSTRDAALQSRKTSWNGFGDSLSPRKTEEALRYLETYVSDYPDDAAMSFFYARLLKKLGKTEKARRLFVRIYIGNNPFSDLARRELSSSDISMDDMFARATTLMKAFEHQKAEAVLRALLPAAGEPLREEVLKTLGQALFRQKRYKEASEIFLKAGDLYNGSRSLYRAGDIAAFRETVSRLASMEDKRAGTLLVAYAAKKRRDGSLQEAIAAYQDVKKNYPSLTEDVLWGMAWAYYRNGDFRKAAEVLTALNDRYVNPRYTYWRQRSGEQDAFAGDAEGRGEDLVVLPRGDKSFTLSETKAARKDFYRMLAYVRGRESLSGRPVSGAAWTQPGSTTLDSRRMGVQPGQLSQEVLPYYDRFTILMQMGMNDEAVGELVRMSGRITKPDLILSVCRTLQTAGAYKRSISLISRFSEEQGIKLGDNQGAADILFPLAYWQVVSDVSERYSLDPFVLLAVMREESRFDPDARSIAGALGLMQIMPHTAYRLDKQLKLNITDAADIYQIKTNITIGAFYLNSLLKEFGSLPVALAAYNAGHEKVREWVRDGKYAAYDEFIEDIPYDETRNYVKRVLLTYFTYLSLGDRGERGN